MVLQLADAPEATAEVNAPTTSTTLQLALGDALAVALLERRGFKPQDFRVFHPGGKLGAMLRTVGDLMHGADELPLVAAAHADAGRAAGDDREALGHRRRHRRATGGWSGAITDGDLRRHIDGLMDHTAGEVMTAGPEEDRAARPCWRPRPWR